MNKEPIGTYIEQALHNVTFRYSTEHVTVVSPFLPEKKWQNTTNVVRGK